MGSLTSPIKPCCLNQSLANSRLFYMLKFGVARLCIVHSIVVCHTLCFLL